MESTLWSNLDVYLYVRFEDIHYSWEHPYKNLLHSFPRELMFGFMKNVLNILHVRLNQFIIYRHAIFMSWLDT